MFYDIHTHKSPNKQTIAIENFILCFSDKKDLKPKQFYSVGYHPCFISEKAIGEISVLKKLIVNNNVLAIGEIGLDKSCKQDFNLQKEIFIQQILLSEKHKKPVILHVVQAYSDILEIRKNTKAKQWWIYHNFNSSFQMAFSLIKNRGILSFGKLLFNKKSKAYHLFKEIPDNAFLLETDDSNYTIQEIYKKAAEIKNTSIFAIKKNVQCNFARIFLSI
jgi:TatD DNase family protein